MLQHSAGTPLDIRAGARWMNVVTVHFDEHHAPSDKWFAKDCVPFVERQLLCTFKTSPIGKRAEEALTEERRTPSRYFELGLIAFPSRAGERHSRC